MSLNTDRRDVDGVTILDLTGRLTLGPESDHFAEQIAALVTDERKNLLLNMKHLGTVDSTGLGNLVLAQSRLKDIGGTVKLLNLSPKHQDLLVLTKLTFIFQLFDDEQTAIDSFYPERETHGFDILQFVQSQKSHTETSGEDEKED